MAIRIKEVRVLTGKDKDVEVAIIGTVNVEVQCAECGIALEIASISSGEKYKPTDTVIIEVKPHKCEE